MQIEVLTRVSAVTGAGDGPRSGAEVVRGRSQPARVPGGNRRPQFSPGHALCEERARQGESSLGALPVNPRAIT